MLSSKSSVCHTDEMAGPETLNMCEWIREGYLDYIYFFEVECFFEFAVLFELQCF